MKRTVSAGSAKALASEATVSLSLPPSMPLFPLLAALLVMMRVSAQESGDNSPSEAPTLMVMALMNDTNSSLAPSMAPTYVGNISPLCGNETESFSQNENLTAALEVLLSGYKDEFSKACPFTITDTGCAVTFGNADDNTTYDELCVTLGGQIYQHPVILQCGVVPLNTDYDLGVVPQCISTACNVSEVDMTLLADPNVTSFGDSLDNGGCQGKVDTSVGHLSHQLQLQLAVASILVIPIAMAMSGLVCD